MNVNPNIRLFYITSILVIFPLTGFLSTILAQSVSTTNNDFGALYNWFSVDSRFNDGKNVCPVGWHLPSDLESTELEVYLQNNDHNYDGTIDTDQNRETNNKIAKSLASKTEWWASNTEGVPGNTDYETYRNKSGFTALPAGFRGTLGLFTGLGEMAYFWIAPSESGGPNAWFLIVLSEYIYSSLGSDCPATQINTGASVRCVRD